MRARCIYHSVLSCTYLLKKRSHTIVLWRGVVHVGLGFGGVAIEGDREEEA